MSILSGLHVALRAVLAHQHSIEIIEHNVANAATPGYRRQAARLATTPPLAIRGLHGGMALGQIGTGVKVDTIQRFTLDFFDGRLRREQAEAGGWAVASNTLQQAEAVMAEMGGDGLATRLDAFWSAWQDLSGDPTNPALRAAVRQRGEALADGFNTRAQALIALRRDQDAALRENVAEINQLAEQTARLNTEIVRVQAAGNQPNDLLDERDRALDRLSALTGAVAHVEADGQALVSIGGHVLVMGNAAQSLTTVADPANSNLARVTWSDGAALQVARGEVAGLLHARDDVLVDQLNGLNTAAQTLANRVNTLHRAGVGLPPANATGLDFFQPFVGSDYALELTVNPALSDSNNIAAAAAANQPGDGSVALAIADVQRELLLAGGTTTLNKYYATQVADLGYALQRARAGRDDHQMVADSLEAQRESVSGVSLDEEAARLVESQRAYEAAARLMTALDDMLDRVINGMGRVGR
jgi:flagellar hook-associated protein 1 FlgK